MRDALLAAGAAPSFLLLGVCYGGRLAYELAASLTRAGEPVAFSESSTAILPLA